MLLLPKNKSDNLFFVSYIRLFMNDRVHQVGGENGRKKRLL